MANLQADSRQSLLDPIGLNNAVKNRHGYREVDQRRSRDGRRLIPRTLNYFVVYSCDSIRRSDFVFGQIVLMCLGKLPMRIGSKISPEWPGPGLVDTGFMQPDLVRIARG